MPTEIIGVQLEVNGTGELQKSVGTLRQQLKAAVIDLQSMQEQFGDISPEAQKAAKAVAELRDSIKDSQEVAELFDPEKKFQAFVNVAQGVASGFAAAQGAMALFGQESEELEKTLLKVQSAMALAQGLAGVRAATEDFKRLIGVLAGMSVVQKANAVANTAAAATMKLFGIATETTSFAFKALKTAIITTGIGALVVGLGYVIEKLSSTATKTNEAAEAQKAYNKAIEDGTDALANEVIGLREQDKALEIARAKARGASEAEINEITRKYNREFATVRRTALEELQKDGFNAAQAQIAYSKQVTDNQIFEYGVQQKAREDAEAKEKTARDKRASDKKAADDKQKGLDEQALREKEQEQQKLGELFQKSQEKIVEDELNTIELKKQGEADFVAYQGQLGKARFDEEQKQADARKELALKEKEAKIAAAQSVSQALMGFAALAGEQTAAGKAFAAASATIQAILGAQQAFTAMSAIPIVGPALGAIAAAGAIAAGIANVRKIYAVQIPGQSAGGSGPVPSLATNAPLQPQRPQTSTVALNQQSINQIGSATQPVRAYVVESDITASQNRVSRIENAAKFR